MKIFNCLRFSLLLSAFALAGCDKPASPASTAKVDPPKGGTEEKHDHGKGPNGGVVMDLGKYHAEFTVDHDKKECTILFVTADDKDAKALPVTCKELTVTTKPSKTKEGTVVPAMTIKMLPKDEKEGKAAKFVGTDLTLGNVADFEGTVTGEIDGKPSQGTFKE
ncbi:hypothetical protein BH11PLA2_BH11PLA2_31220 [soil metagenome]